jgi:hypothetical protein
LETDTENIDLEQLLTITMGETSREEVVAALGLVRSLFFAPPIEIKKKLRKLRRDMV